MVGRVDTGINQFLSCECDFNLTSDRFCLVGVFRLTEHHVFPEEPRERRFGQQRPPQPQLALGARGPPGPVEAPAAGAALRQPREVAARAGWADR